MVEESVSPGRDLASVMEQLRDIPFRPHRLGGRASTLAGWAPDMLPMLLDTHRRTAGYLYPYPRHWRPVVFPSLDGTPLAGVLALHDDGRPRPGLVVVHGVFSSRGGLNVRALALRAHLEWGFNVLAMDMRMFGSSRKLSDALATGGRKEGEDIAAGAGYLGSLGCVTTVGVVGFSLGAGSSLVAAGLDRGERITGGVLAWNAHADARRILGSISKAPKPWQPYALVYPAFATFFLLKMRDFGLSGTRDFTQFYSWACENIWHADEGEMYSLASPRNYLEDVRVPTLHVHAIDDPVIPVREAEDNREAAAGNPNVDIWILPRGGHCSFHMVDVNWYRRVTRDFLEAWAERP